MKPVTARLAEELEVGPAQVAAAVRLLDEGATVPFIVRYRQSSPPARRHRTTGGDPLPSHP